MDALNGKEGPWGGNIRVQRARGETWNSEERKSRWSNSRESAAAPAETTVDA